MTEERLKEIVEAVMKDLDITLDEIKVMPMSAILEQYEKIKEGQ